jgi:hypothetical protein
VFSYFIVINQYFYIELRQVLFYAYPFHYTSFKGLSKFTSL